MRIKINESQALPSFDYTITVLNKLKARHNPNKVDVWFKTELYNNSWQGVTVRNVQGTTVIVGNSIITRVPKNYRYLPYNAWIIADKEEFFTFSTGDIIIKGEIDEEDLKNNNDVMNILEKYKPDAFVIKSFKNNTGTIEALEHYRIEGT